MGIKETVITSDISIGSSQTLRRLALNEVIEVLEGPIKDDQSEVVRVRAKTMEDGLEGWITVQGNQGSMFLQEGGNVFKVIKETILTESFEIQATKEKVRRVRDLTRKLKPGE